MAAIGERMRALRERGEKAFVPYMTCGFPSLEATADILVALDEAGADVIELGVPFSDPVADGPTIQRSSQAALDAGTTLARIIEFVGPLRSRLDCALMLFGYANPFYRMGYPELVRRATDAGIDGLLVPDLPPESAGELLEAIAAAASAPALDTCFLIAPTSTEERIRRVDEVSTGFVYAVSLTGVTGVRAELPAETQDFLKRAKKIVGNPMVVGFGISTPEQAFEIAQLADGVVVGSVLVREIERAADEHEAVERVAALAASLAKAVKSRR